MEGIRQNCGVYILYMYLKVFKRLQKKRKRKIRRVCYQRASEWPRPAVEDGTVQSSVLIFVLVNLETGCEKSDVCFQSL